MATVTATITIDFTSNTAGSHRACWRIQGSGDPYDCTTIVNCVGGATTCQAIINTDVNTTSCDGTVIFEGYIQAACEDILSTSGRLIWSAGFVPTVVCDKHEVLCARGTLQSIDVLAGGDGYNLLDTVNIIRQPGDTEASDAIASISTLGTGVINSVASIFAAGAGYVALDVITVNDLGGAGTGATIRVDTVGGGGDILTYTLLTNGSDYVGAFSFSGGTGTEAIFEIQIGVDYDPLGAITGVTVSTPGLYSIVPLITIDPATGTGALLEATLTPCPVYNNVGVDCIGGDTVNITAASMQVGEIFGTCIEGGLVGATPAEYDVTATGCCIAADSTSTACTDVHLENASGGLVNVHVTLCNGDDSTIAVADGTTEAVCLVTDGWIDPNVVGFTIADQGTPCS